jgi:hypothetical protein
MLLLGAAATGFTQSKLTEEQKKEFKEKQEAYKAKLNLTEDQATKMEAINMTWLEGLSALKGSSGPKLSKYKRFKSLNNERDTQAKKILTEEQYKLFKQQQKEMKEELKEHGSKR